MKNLKVGQRIKFKKRTDIVQIISIQEKSIVYIKGKSMITKLWNQLVLNINIIRGDIMAVMDVMDSALKKTKSLRFFKNEPRFQLCP